MKSETEKTFLFNNTKFSGKKHFVKEIDIPSIIL